MGDLSNSHQSGDAAWMLNFFVCQQNNNTCFQNFVYKEKKLAHIVEQHLSKEKY